MPVDSLLTPFLTQQVHSKITRILISLPLAMNLLFILDQLHFRTLLIFFFIFIIMNYFIFGSDQKKKLY